MTKERKGNERAAARRHLFSQVVFTQVLLFIYALNDFPEPTTILKVAKAQRYALSWKLYQGMEHVQIEFLKIHTHSSGCFFLRERNKFQTEPKHIGRSGISHSFTDIP